MVEVVAQDAAGQKNRCDAQALLLDLGRNKVLIAFVEFGRGDVGDGYLIETALEPRGGGILGDVNLGANRIGRRNRKCDLIAGGDVTCQPVGYTQPGLIRQDASASLCLALDAEHAFPTARREAGWRTGES